MASKTASVDEAVEVSLNAQAQLWKLSMGHLKSKCLKCAVQLGIPDAILRHGGPATISDLCSALSIHPTKSRFLRTMMRLLSHEGLFSSSLSGEEEAFDINPVSRRILTSTISPYPSTSQFVNLVLHPTFVDPCHQLSEWFLRQEVTTNLFTMANGMTIWDMAKTKPAFNDLFNAAMSSDSCFLKDVLAPIGRDVFSGIGTLVDVGGGNGTLAAVLTEEFPGLRCTVLELPHVVDAPGKAAGVEFVCGDMFSEVPRADAILLKWILRGWSDEDCVKILQRCRESISPKEKGGKVIIIDTVVGVADNNVPTFLETQLLFDLQMMIVNPGKDRDEDEWRIVFFAAGFSDYKITPFGARSIIELYP